MKDPQVAYFFKRFYHNIIKWWFVVYNPVAKRIWPSKQEEEDALEKERIEEEKRAEEERLAAEAEAARLAAEAEEKARLEAEAQKKVVINDATYNETTGSYSGLYGQKPVDAETQAALDAIMGNTSKQNSVDSLFNSTPIPEPEPAPVSEEQEAIIKEANVIYERLMREAAEDEAKKQAEIEAAKAAPN